MEAPTLALSAQSSSQFIMLLIPSDVIHSTTHTFIFLFLVQLWSVMSYEKLYLHAIPLQFMCDTTFITVSTARNKLFIKDITPGINFHFEDIFTNHFSSKICLFVKFFNLFQFKTKIDPIYFVSTQSCGEQLILTLTSESLVKIWKLRCP